MAFDVLYLSPHPDDVAFSAAARVAADVAAGVRVGLLTLFEADAGPSVFSNFAARRAEDDAYVALSKVTMVRGGWRDAIVRHRRYRSPRRLFGTVHKDQEPLIVEIAEFLQEQVASGCRKIVAPLGVGNHVDHQLTYLAASRVAASELLYYEDIPYVLTPFQLPRRLARLGLAPDECDATLERGTVGQELSAAARAWQESPVLQALVRPSLRKFALANILSSEVLAWPRQRAPQAYLRAEILDEPDVGELKLAAVACYASQWPLFFPTLAGWRARLEEYGRSMGRAGVVERAWRSVDQ